MTVTAIRKDNKHKRKTPSSILARKRYRSSHNFDITLNELPPFPAYPKAKLQELVKGSREYKRVLELHRYEGEDVAGQRGVIQKHNIGDFYVHLCQALFGGRIVHKDGNSGRNTPGLNYMPDIIIRKRDGTNHVEVKGFGTKRQVECRKGQAEGFVYNLLRRMDAGEVTPEVDYALFRYQKTDHHHFHQIEAQDLLNLVAQNTQDLLILPTNLILFLLAFSSPREKDHSTSKQGKNDLYYAITRAGTTILRTHYHNPAEALEAIEECRTPRMNKRSGLRGPIITEKTKRDLYLDRLVAEQFSSSDLVGRLSVNGIPINPFTITHYHMPRNDYTEWLAHFSENHGSVLNEICLSDLHEQDGNGREILPF